MEFAKQPGGLREYLVYGVSQGHVLVGHNNPGVRDIAVAKKQPIGLEDLLKILLGLVEKKCIANRQSSMQTSRPRDLEEG